MTRDEIDEELELLTLNEALDAAKAAYNGEEIGPTQKALKDAEWACNEFTMKRRAARETARQSMTTEQVLADMESDLNGVAAPPPVQAGINPTNEGEG